jgi:hypothetical protein
MSVSATRDTFIRRLGWDPDKLSWQGSKSNYWNLSRIETRDEKNWQKIPPCDDRILQGLQISSFEKAFFTTDPLKNPNDSGLI